MSEKQKSTPLRLVAYDYIKQKILSCEYEPGVRLNEQQLCDEMGGISRTPVRDALGRLEQEGLLQVLPKKGIIVSNLRLSDVNRIYEVRLLLEPYALRRYGKKLDQDKINEFAEIMNDPARIQDSYDDYYFFDLDNQFHGFLLSPMKNPFLLDTYENISNLNRRIRLLSGAHSENRIADTFAEHMKIISACQKKDWEAAANAMTEHLEQSRVVSFQMLAENEDAF